MSNSFPAHAAVRHFQIDGDFVSASPYGSGHINDTYIVLFHQSSAPARFILQRLNTAIFHNPAALMENMERVTKHLASHLLGEPERDRRVLTLIPARDERPLFQDPEGGCWRMVRFIDRSRTYDTVSSPSQAYQAAKAFGLFQKMLVDLSGPRLHDTIPDFHNTPKRLSAFEDALAADIVGRATRAKPEIDFAQARRSLARVLLDSDLPERVTHNDTKFNNVLFDDATGEALCVVDLDTVMPGLALYDFGDMVRTATSFAGEDEPDLSKVAVQFPMFEALLRGYLSSTAGFLTDVEKRLLVSAGKVITFEQGLRFLADFVNGDTYYKVQREGHNLERCRTQFKLIQSLEQQEGQMNLLVDRVLNEPCVLTSPAAQC